MEAVKREFWCNIPTDNASPDLQVERDPNEEVFDVTNVAEEHKNKFLITIL